MGFNHWMIEVGSIGIWHRDWYSLALVSGLPSVSIGWCYLGIGVRVGISIWVSIVSMTGYRHEHGLGGCTVHTYMAEVFEYT